MNFAVEITVLLIEYVLFMGGAAVVIWVIDNVLLKHPKTRAFMLGLLGLKESDLYKVTNEQTVEKSAFDKEIESLVNECFKCG